MYRLLSRILVCGLCVQLVFLPLTLAFGKRGEPQSKSALIQAALPIFDHNYVLDGLDRSLQESQADTPPRLNDRFGLTRQGLILYSTQGIETYNHSVSEPQPATLHIPYPMEQSGASDGKVVLGGEGRFLEFHRSDRKGRVRAIHSAELEHVVTTFSQDHDFLLLLDKKGTLFGVNQLLVNAHIFHAPIPRIRIAKIDPKLFDPDKPVKIAFLNLGMKPISEHEIAPGAIVPNDKPIFGREALVNEGDIIIYQEGAQPGDDRKVVAWLDRDVAHSMMALGENILAYENLALLPPEEAKSLLLHWAQISGDQMGEIQGRAQKGPLEMDPLTAKALQAFNKKDIKRFLRASDRSLLPSGYIKNQFSHAEWQRDYDAIQAAIIEAGQKAETRSYKEYLKNSHSSGLPKPRVAPWHKLISSNGLRTIAKLVAVGAGVSFGLPEVYQANPQAFWWIHSLNEWFHGVYHNVLSDHVYRITLLKSTLLIGSLLPILAGVGVLLDRSRPLDFAKNLASTAIRNVYVWTLRPVTQYAVSLAGNPHMLQALRAGYNPFEVISPESALGKHLKLEHPKRLAVDAPVGLTETWANLKGAPVLGSNSSRGADRVGAYISADRNTQALAWFLANILISETEGVDLPSLILAQTSGASPPGRVSKISNHTHQENWTRLAHALTEDLKKLSRLDQYDPFARITETQIAEYLKRARAISLELKKNQNLLTRAKTKWKMVQKRARQIAGAALLLGDREHQDLKRLEFSKFTSDQYWKDLVLDHFVTMFQVSLLGARAELADPASLAAVNNPYSLYTHPAQLAEYADALRINISDVPASIALVFKEGFEPKDSEYRAKEYWLDLPVQKRMAFVQGLKNWFSGAFNFYDNRLGNYMMRDFITGLKTIQVAVLWGVLIRGGVLLATAGSESSSISANLSALFGGFTYFYIANRWSLGAWWTFLNVGNEKYARDHRDKVVEYYTERARFSQGLRNNRKEQWASGYEKLTAIYKNSSEMRPFEELEKAMREVEGFLKLSGDEKLSYLAASHLEMSGLTHVYHEWRDGGRNEEKLRILYEALKSKAPATPEALASFSRYITEHPPIHLKNNKVWPWVSTLLTIGGASYWGTHISVASYALGAGWVEPVVSLAAKTALIYGAGMIGQKAIDKHFSRKHNKVKPECAQALGLPKEQML